MESNHNSTPPAFGHEIKEKYFLFEKGLINLNHGSFGAPPRQVLEAKRQFETECESWPDRWYRGGYQKHLEENRQLLSQYLNSDPDDIIFTESASTAINSILRSFNFQPGDTVLYFSTIYPMVMNMLNYLKEFAKINLVEVKIVFPGKGKAPIGLYGSLLDSIKEELIRSNGKIKLASFSHITSNPGIILPIEEMIPLFKSYGVSVLIDGAHSLGQLPLNMKALESLGMDYYTSNGHKWLYTTKGSAILWVAKSKQQSVIPTVISYAFATNGLVPDRTAYLGRFQYTGTRDYSSFCIYKSALAFIKEIGQEKIREYNHNLAVWAQHYLAQSWKTEVLVPDSMTGMMAHVRIPPAIKNMEQADWLYKTLNEDYHIQTVHFPLVNPITKEETYWFRLSAQIYVEKSDFIKLDEAVRHLISRLPLKNSNL